MQVWACGHVLDCMVQCAKNSIKIFYMPSVACVKLVQERTGTWSGDPAGRRLRSCGEPQSPRTSSDEGPEMPRTCRPLVKQAHGARVRLSWGESPRLARRAKRRGPESGVVAAERGRRGDPGDVVGAGSAG